MQPQTSRSVLYVSIVLLSTSLAAGCASAPPAGGSDAQAASDDSVHVGYGTQDPDELTGSVSSVRARDLNREVTSFEDLVQGMAGVHVVHHPDGGISLQIRGTPSFSGSTEPLYVINGQIMNGPTGSALLGVNPRDVTRIDVLKDAGSTAIYGSRGANGVVVITTVRAPR